MNAPSVPAARRPYRFDFPNLKVGYAEYAEGPTGCTVVTLPRYSLATVDIRGGSPGVVMGLDGLVDAVCFTGGSLYGLEAVAGVTDAIARERGGGIRPTASEDIPVVRGATIYDFRREPPNDVTPDKALGVFAYANATEGVFPSGPVGAARSAAVGKMGVWAGPAVEPEGGGQGAACATVKVRDDLEASIFVCTVVNSLGGIVDRRGDVVRGHLDAAARRRLRAAEVIERSGPVARPCRGNTTLSLVVTNIGVPDFWARQAARQIHSSMARALDPFHTELDGDVLFFVRTGDATWLRDEGEYESATRTVGVVGAELMWDAILNAWQP